MSIHEVEVDRNGIIQTSRELGPKNSIGYPGHFIGHGGLNVTLQLGGIDHYAIRNDREVIVEIGRIRGSLENLHVLGFGQNQIWTADKIRKIEAVVLRPEIGESVVVLGKNDPSLPTYKRVMRLEKNPSQGDREIDYLAENRNADIK
jgi:hypothetical protein